VGHLIAITEYGHSVRLSGGISRALGYGTTNTALSVIIECRVADLESNFTTNEQRPCSPHIVYTILKARRFNAYS